MYFVSLPTLQFLKILVLTCRKEECFEPFDLTGDCHTERKMFFYQYFLAHDT
jgi:hypothetical protein